MSRIDRNKYLFKKGHKKEIKSFGNMNLTTNINDSKSQNVNIILIQNITSSFHQNASIDQGYINDFRIEIQSTIKKINSESRKRQILKELVKLMHC